jgi:DNA repair protein RecN (Recombination protein N)
MLESLVIRNLAVIESSVIPFTSGLNILSGETGAGKSIVIEAIGLLLGGRASIELIRAGCDEATVEGAFDLEPMPWVRKRLEDHGFPCEEGTLLIKRIIHRGGRHRIWLNGLSATLSTLQQICDGLIDLCGQHEHQSLLRATTQLELLDRYAGQEESVHRFAREWDRFVGVKEEVAALESDEADRVKRTDFLEFQIGELRAAELEPNEDEQLAGEKLLLQTAETRVQTAEAVRGILEDEGSGVIEALRGALSRLRNLHQLDERVAPMREGLERGLVELEEVSLALNRYLGASDLDPERLTTVQERLSLIADLRRKYGTTVAEMLETLARLEGELESLGRSGTRLEEARAEADSLRVALRTMAADLTSKRVKFAKLLAESVTGELADLKMGDAVFQIELGSKGTDVDAWNATGADHIQFVVQTNRGEAARPLGKIASGGELSRLMLAIRRVIADKGKIGVYLFDEIDAGIGGQTAFEVGRKLKSVAAYNQVICITHLPQVASFADHHLSVRKVASGRRTLTEVVELKTTERKQELARMLGGPELTKKSLENAAELLALALAGR